MEATIKFLDFSPDGGCTDTIVNVVNAAKKSVYVQAYNYTSRPLNDALKALYAGKIDVKGIFDHRASEEQFSLVPDLAKSVPVWIDSKHPIAHNKIIIVDTKIVITGSFNFSVSAEKYNAENLIVLESVPLARRYLKNFQLHWGHSTPFAQTPKLASLPPLDLSRF